ncbi:MAG: hypothetical protein WC959_10265 [Kiritimatiellales bacterium]
MSGLSAVTLAAGIVALLAGAAMIAKPQMMRSWMERFPRSIWPGRILAAIDLIWAAYALSLMHLGMFDAWKVHLWWLTPIAVFLCIKYLDELLSPRALGGFFLLLAGPVLYVTRWHESEWRVVMAAISYIWILTGLLFLLSPWWFRRIALVVCKTTGRLKAAGAVKAITGIALILLAVFVYT